MNWSSPTEFFHMGGYGVYVWGSYVVAAVTCLAEVWLLGRRRRKARRRVAGPARGQQAS